MYEEVVKTLINVKEKCVFATSGSAMKIKKKLLLAKLLT